MKIRGIVPAIPHPRALKVLLLIGDVCLYLRYPDE
nr:MAG TPA: HMG box-containing protein 1, HMG box transcription factor [Caudoviricetes sp.]